MPSVGRVPASGPGPRLPPRWGSQHPQWGTTLQQSRTRTRPEGSFVHVPTKIHGNSTVHMLNAQTLRSFGPLLLPSSCLLSLPCWGQAPRPSPCPLRPPPSRSVASGEGCPSSAQNLRELSTHSLTGKTLAGRAAASPRRSVTAPCPQLLRTTLLLSCLLAGPTHSPPASAPASLPSGES